MKHFHSYWKTDGALFLLLVVLAALSWNCKPKVTELHANVPPYIHLANVPSTEDTTRTAGPLLKLSWWGNDADGYVVGFRYRWTFRLSSHDPYQYKPYTTILNIAGYRGEKKYTLVALTEDLGKIPAIYKYFATLPKEGLDPVSFATLGRGDTILVEGVPIFASNSDSTRVPNTTIRVKNQFPIHDNPYTGNFIFDSQDTLNFHTFEIQAIDNDGKASLAAAKVSFETPQVAAPKTEVVFAPFDTVYILPKKTDTFKGISFRFLGTDPNSRFEEYSWVCDRDEWGSAPIPWSDFTLVDHAEITSANFPPGTETRLQHRFYVRARNEFGVIDTVGAFPRTVYSNATPPESTGVQMIHADTVFYALTPSFISNPGRILVINNSNDVQSTDISRPSRQMIEDYYASLLDGLGFSGKYDFFRVTADSFPSITFVSRYSSIIFVADYIEQLFFTANPQLSGSHENILKQFCYIGGNLILSGWNLRNPQSFSETDQSPEGFAKGVLHLGPRVYTIPVRPTFDGFPNFGIVRIDGANGYPSVQFDPAKLTDSLWRNALPGAEILRPYGFGEVTHTMHTIIYDSVRPILFGPPVAQLKIYDLTGSPVGIRYINGPVFTSAFYGFPLYYLRRDDALHTLEKTFKDFGVIR